MADKYRDTLAKSRVTTDDAAVKAAVEKILSEHLQENMNKEVYTTLFNSIDLTTLKTTDSTRSVTAFVERVNAFDEEHPELPNVAAICVYPNFVPVVRTVLDVSSVDIAAVAGGFPTSQTFPEVKVAEVALAVEAGADEIDVVLNVGDFLSHDYEALADDLQEMKHSCRNALMKVILETGALKTAENIRNASVLALFSGADFLKTSTGKEYPGASLEACYVMCQCIKEYYEQTGRKVGFKASGGIRTTADAMGYYTIVREVLGEEWLCKDLFRIGASSLGNALLSSLEDQEVKFF